MSYGSDERLKAIDLAAEMHRGQAGTLTAWDLERVLRTAKTITNFVLDGHLPAPAEQQKQEAAPAGAISGTSLKEANPSTAILNEHVDPLSKNTVFTLTRGAAEEAGASPAPTSKERKPRGPNKAKKAKGTRGRPRKVAEVALGKDGPPIANGAGEHAPAPITGDEPQPIAA